MTGGMDGELCCLSWSYGVSCRTLSHVCGSWYMSKFLFSEGSLTFMYIASLMSLMTPCDCLLTMLKQLGLPGCPVE